MKRWDSERLTFWPGARRDAVRRGVFQNGGIYFLLGDITGHVKIGWSKTPLSRAMDIAAECSERLTYLGTLGPFPKAKEAELHRQFAHHRVVGEWFWPGDDLLAFLRDQVGATLQVLPPAPELDRTPAGEQKSDALVGLSNFSPKTTNNANGLLGDRLTVGPPQSADIYRARPTIPDLFTATKA